jgi:hypothetical protein
VPINTPINQYILGENVANLGFEMLGERRAAVVELATGRLRKLIMFFIIK